MYDVQLQCVTKPHKGTVWWLRLTDDGQAVLFDPAQVVVRAVGAHEAGAAFRMPSFGQSIKYFGVYVNGGLIEFSAQKTDMQAIQAFLDQGVLAGGTDGVAKLRNQGYRDIVVGGVLTVAGVGVTVLSYMAVSSRGGRYYLTWGVVLWGLITFFRGVGKVGRAGRLAPHAQPAFPVVPSQPVGSSPPPPRP
jgi:hypothetical protein